MNDYNDELKKQLNQKNNVLLYQENLRQYYQNRNKNIKAAYIQTPRKGKTAYEQMVKTFDKDNVTKNKTISKLLEEIIKEAEKEVIHLYIDNFEQLSKRELENYKELEQEDNIIFIANIKTDKEFIDSEFLNKFVLFNSENFAGNRSHSINITYVLLLLFSLLVFLTFLKIQLTLLRYIISGLWFTLLMYRSFYYMTK